jgi:hypothetical protein
MIPMIVLLLVTRGMLTVATAVIVGALAFPAPLPTEICALAERQVVRVDPAHIWDDLMRIEMEVRSALSA